MRRREWFAHTPAVTRSWQVPEGHTPTLEEGTARLAAPRAYGPRPGAFTFRERYDPAGAPGARAYSSVAANRPAAAEARK